MKKFLYRLTLPIQYLLVFLFIVFEEFIWEGIAVPVGTYLQSLRLLQSLESLIRRMNRYLLLVLFVALFVSVELAGVTAGVLVVRGMGLFGVLLYALKIPIAAFTFWLFRISRDKLLSFAWFRWVYAKLLLFLDWLKSRKIYLRSMEIFRRIKKRLVGILEKLRRFFPQGRNELFRHLRILYRRLRERLNRHRLK